MSDVPTNPPQNPEHELFETLLSKFIVTFLFAILGFVLVLLAYVIPSTFDFDETVFETSSSTYFTVSIAIWMLIGLTTPFISLRRVFEELKGIMFQHVVIFITAVVVFVFIYWFFITFIVSTIISIFGIE
jgi:hypothetical protein